jgi:hypothetical protein
MAGSAAAQLLLMWLSVASALLAGQPACAYEEQQREESNGIGSSQGGRRLRGLQTGAHYVRGQEQSPKLFTYTIRQQHYHDPDSFTQGRAQCRWESQQCISAHACLSIDAPRGSEYGHLGETQTPTLLQGVRLLVLSMGP